MCEPFKNILYIARRFKLATAFNFLGLVAAFAAFYLIMAQVIFQTTYNDGIDDSERLYRIDSDFLNNNHLLSGKIFYPVTDVLDRLPEIESYSLMYNIQDDDPVYASYYKQRFQTLEKDDTIEFTANSLCNEKVVSTLTGKRVSGDIEWDANDTVSELRGVIIPKSLAIRYFGKEDAAGDTLRQVWEDVTYPWLVRGVYEDFPKNSEFGNHIYVIMPDQYKVAYKHSLAPSFKCFIKFKQQPDDVKALSKKLKQGIIDLMEKEGWEKYAVKADMRVPTLKTAINDMNLSLTSIEDSYFETSASVGPKKHGFKPMLIVQVTACILLIIIATIHFLNFALVESPMRVRGINIRLVLGASRRRQQQGIIAECVITSVIACIIAQLLCGWLLHTSFIHQLIDVGLGLRYYGLLALFTLLVAVVVGIVAGFYPAKFVTSITPALALKSDFGLTPEGHNLRKAIIGIQLFISFLMVIYLGALIQERHYIYNSAYLYDKDNVLISKLSIITTEDNKRELYQELTALPGVKNVSFSDASMGLSDVHISQLIEVQGKTISYDYTRVDTAYLHTMGINIIAGRSFQPSDTAAAIINKSALQQWGGITVGSRLPSESGNDSLTIVGVCDDIRYNTTRLHSNHPFAFLIEPGGNRAYLNMRLDDHADAETVSRANNILLKHLEKANVDKRDNRIGVNPLAPFKSRLENSYEDEIRFFKWIFILSVVCTLITLIGVFCLMMFESEYRRKEIGIRKIVGATTGEIVTMLCKQYIPLILISFVIAAPIALYSANETLKYFAEHAPIKWWIFPLALLIVGGIVMTIILLQSWRTARENPVNSIKTE